MKKVLFVLISILTYTVHAQGITELETIKSELLNRRSLIEIHLKNVSKVNDSILAIKNDEIETLRLVWDQETNRKDSLNMIIASYKISKENLEIYNLLENKKIIDPNCKSYEKFHKQLMKEYPISKEQKILMIENFFYLAKFDDNGRTNSIEKLILSSNLKEKQQNLLSENKLLFLADNNLFLENLTGVNLVFLQLNTQLEAVIQKLYSTNSKMREIGEFKINQTLLFRKKKKKLDSDYKHLSDYISEIENQILEEQSNIIQKNLNYSNFKTKKINGIEIYTTPLSVMEFRNGGEIRKARTEGEWDKFNELKIPAYHLKDFDDNQANYGFFYNYHAITDNRELAPFGFHKLNYIDFNYLDGQPVFTDTKLVNCYCTDGTENIYETCQNCNHWTESQRKYNACSKCQNKIYIKVGSRKCSSCNGTKKVKEVSMKGRGFCIFPGFGTKIHYDNNFILEVDDFPNNLLGWMRVSENGNCEFGNYKTEEIDKRGHQILIIKDRNPIYSDSINFTKIGDIEFMNTYLNVTKFRNGDPIKYIEDSVEWELAFKNNIPAYCYFNNINDGKGCIYNIHAWNDKRGLIPINWRSITKYDLINVANSLNYNFTLTSAHSPLPLPPGTRNKKGAFETIKKKTEYDDINEDYFRHLNFSISKNAFILESTDTWNHPRNDFGFVICVRDSKFDLFDNFNFTDSNQIELINCSKSTKNEVNWTKFSNSMDYNKIYNQCGVDYISQLVKSDFKALFGGGELKFIGINGEYDCGNGEQFIFRRGSDSDIYAYILRLDLNGDIFCKLRVIGISETYEKPLILDHEEFKLNRRSEFTYSGGGHEFTFEFNSNSCHSSNNPITNFNIRIDYIPSIRVHSFKDNLTQHISNFPKKFIGSIDSALFFIKHNSSNSNINDEEIIESIPIHIFEEMEAEFIGGYQKFKEFFSDNLSSPNEAADLGINGRVIVRCVVEKDGTISNATVETNLADCPACDKEALRVVRMMPKWKPAISSEGYPVRTYVRIPIVFSSQ